MPKPNIFFQYGRSDSEASELYIDDMRYELQSVSEPGNSGFTRFGIPQGRETQRSPVIVKSVYSRGQKSDGLSVPSSQMDAINMLINERDCFTQVYGHDRAVIEGTDEKTRLILSALPGEPLKKVLAAYPYNHAAIFNAVFEAVNSVHDRCVVHRDLHADNILVLYIGRGYFQAALIDFGIANKSRDEEQQCYDLQSFVDLMESYYDKGSNPWMAPFLNYNFGQDSVTKFRSKIKRQLQTAYREEKEPFVSVQSIDRALEQYSQQKGLFRKMQNTEHPLIEKLQALRSELESNTTRVPLRKIEKIGADCKLKEKDKNLAAVIFHELMANARRYDKDLLVEPQEFGITNMHPRKLGQDFRHLTP